MKKFIRKTLAIFLSVLMLISGLFIMQPADAGVFTVNAAAEKITDGNKIGVLNSFTTGWDTESQSYDRITEIIFDSVEYPVAENVKLSYAAADALSQKDVLVRFKNGKVTAIEDARKQTTDVTVGIVPVTFSYAGKSDWWIQKYVKLNGTVSNKKTADSWSAADKIALEEYLALNGLCTYSDVRLELRSKNADAVHFGKGAAYTEISITDIFMPGQELSLPEVKIHINTEYELQGGEEEFEIEYSLVSGADTIVSSGKFIVTVINTDFPEELDFVELPDNLFDILASKVDDYHPGKLTSKEPVVSVFTGLESSKCIKEMKALNEAVNMLKVALDVNNMICAVNIEGVILTAADSYLEKLFEAIEEEAGGLAGYIDDALITIIHSRDFKNYLRWYETTYGYDLGYYTKVEPHCPTDIKVTDFEGNLALTIINNEITVYDELIYADVNAEGEKTFYLPSNVEYNVEITATGDGTMDYSVSSVTPGGAERVITYEDIAISEGEVYTGLVTNEKYSEADSYNLVADNGETVEYTYDSLPPVKSDIADVVIAEELFANLPEKAITLAADAMFNMRASADMSECGIEIGDTVALFSAISKYYPIEYSLLVNGDFTYTVVYNKADNQIIQIKFDYGQDANLTQYQEKVNTVKAKINAIVSETEGMDDFEKALYLHDYIVLNCRYDTELLDILETEGTLKGSMRSDRYSEYAVLINGTGICGSYALAYRALMNAADIECIYLSSEQMCHAWNMVKIDGKWYHVDCCWDDPVPDREGKARRTYFLRTDKEMMKLEHFSWTPGQYKATDGKYSSMPRLYDTEQKYDYESNCWYYLLPDGIYKADKYGNNKKKLTDAVSAEAIACDNGKIYYSEGIFVYEYDFENAEWKPVYYLTDEEAGYFDGAYVVNFFIDGENISLYKYVQEYNDETWEYEVKTVFAENELNRDFFEAITGITLDKTELELELFKSGYLSASIVSEYDTYDLDIEWSSSDESVATVSEWGTVTANNTGTATITASFMEFSASCTVTVTGDGYEGSCGSKITWSFNPDTGVLTLTGTGAIPDYSSYNTPWNSFKTHIKEIVIGSGITDIGTYAFYGCSAAEKITIPEGVQYLRDYSFSYCRKVNEITLPSTLRAIYFNAFEWCEALESITIPDGIDIIHNYVFRGCSSLKTVVLPESVVQLAQGSFAHCIKLESINIPSNVKIIGQQAFFCCESLKTLHFPASVTTLYTNTLQNCDGMLKYTVDPGNPTLSVDEYGVLFYNDTIIASYPSGSAYTEYEVPSRVTAISSYAFENAKNLEAVTLPEGLLTMKLNAFRGCTALKKVTVPGTVTTIENHIFDGCTSLEEVIIGEGITTLANYMFQDCTALKSVTLPETLLSIGSYAFLTCSSLRNVVLPASLSTVSSSAFSGCAGLTHVAYKCTQEEASAITVGSYNDYFVNAPYVHYGFKDEDVISMGGNAPTCTENGMSEGLYCTVCDCSLTGEMLEATGHSYLVTESFEGSCTEAPFKVYTCRCGDSYTVHESKLTGHKYETEIIAPTCKKAGYSVNTCSVCGENSVTDFTSPTGHRLFIRNDESYCEGHGTYEYYCISCEYTEYVTIDASELETKTVTVESTCTEGGSVSEVCVLCEATVSTEMLSPKGHTYSDEWTVDKAASPTENGEKSRHCINCDARTDITEIEFEGCLHENTSIVNEKEPTCNEEGYTGDTVCTCGETVFFGEVIPATGKHTGGTASCKDKAVCDVCGNAYGDVNPENHKNVVTDKAVSATCSARGLTEGSHCDACGVIIVKQTETQKLQHSYSSVVTAPDCVNGGYTTYICSACNDTYRGDETSKLGHNMSDFTVIEKPTCTEKGIKISECSRCGHCETKAIAVTEHSFEDGSCTVCGKEKSENCSHLCHKDGFMGFIWKIVQFFWKLFGMNPVCECGKAHY